MKWSVYAMTDGQVIRKPSSTGILKHSTFLVHLDWLEGSLFFLQYQSSKSVESKNNFVKNEHLDLVFGTMNGLVLEQSKNCRSKFKVKQVENSTASGKVFSCMLIDKFYAKKIWCSAKYVYYDLIVYR